MSGNRIAAIREKFAKGGSSIPTPESQFKQMKKSKADNARAIRVAKARAARYNMTLRALAIKSSIQTTKLQSSTITDKKKVSKENAKYKATKRGLQVAGGVTAKDRVNISKALNEEVSPTIARNMIKAVAKKNYAENQAKTRALRKASKKLLTEEPAQEEDEDVKTDDEDSFAEVEEEKEVVEETEAVEEVKEERPKKKIEMTGVQEAIKAGDEDALNKAILKNFLASHAPHMEDKADELLGQFNSKLDLLFKTLLKKFPDETDAEISGEQKADKEVADAVESGDKVLPPEAEIPPAADEEGEESDDDSMVMDETQIDKFEEEEKPKPVVNTKPKTVMKEMKVEDFTLDLISDDEDSFVEVQDEKFEDGYNKTLERAEKGNIGVMKSLARRRTTLKLNDELSKQVEEYKKEERKSIMSLKTLEEDGEDDDDSLVESPYIVNLEETIEEDNKGEEEAPVRWAVQFENKNYALKKKLLKQGLTEDQVAQLVDNLDNNTSEML